MIAPIRTRSDFERLRREGRRIRIEPFWCAHLTIPAASHARIAFAINRAVGNAVVRNRLRRRARAILAELTLPPGLYLIGCRPDASELTFAQMQHSLGKLPSKIAST